MRLAIITPVGPGHEQAVKRAQASVSKARIGGFDCTAHVIIDDTEGSLGRSRARNQGMDRVRADWFFFLDADDQLHPDALTRNDFEASATFGAISLDGVRVRNNIWPCAWRDIALKGASGTLSMGFFCRADVARKLRFNEELDAGEDFEFYLRLPDFTKRKGPLVHIGRSIPSAHGPRGYERLDWTLVCNREIVKAVKMEPEKYDLGRYAVLAKAPRALAKLEAVSRTLSE